MTENTPSKIIIKKKIDQQSIKSVINNVSEEPKKKIIIKKKTDSHPTIDTDVLLIEEPKKILKKKTIKKKTDTDKHSTQGVFAETCTDIGEKSAKTIKKKPSGESIVDKPVEINVETKPKKKTEKQIKPEILLVSQKKTKELSIGSLVDPMDPALASVKQKILNLENRVNVQIVETAPISIIPVNIAEESKKEDTETPQFDIDELLNEGDLVEEPSIPYVYPEEQIYMSKEKFDIKYFPKGSQWINDNQIDDNVSLEEIKRRTEIFRELQSREYTVQGSLEWHAERREKITASDAGTVIGINTHEVQYNFILKKVNEPEFTSNVFTHHGKKYERIASMIYEYRTNVKTEEFGLVSHMSDNFLGASPDGIVCEYKNDMIHKTKDVGKMIEIKCPLKREIQSRGNIVGTICPIAYWVQVQQQLECCDLDECDFWQCNIKEYASREEFIADTNGDEPFRSRETCFEKGFAIQLLPKSRASEAIESTNKYKDVVYSSSKYIYPPKIEMTPFECDQFIIDTLNNLHSDPLYEKYYFDRILYWKLNNSNCTLIVRNKEWWDEVSPSMKKVWDQVVFFRNNMDKYKILSDYIDSMGRKMNKKIMEAVIVLCENKKNDPRTKKIIDQTKKNIEMRENKRKMTDDNIDYDGVHYSENLAV